MIILCTQDVYHIISYHINLYIYIYISSQDSMRGCILMQVWNNLSSRLRDKAESMHRVAGFWLHVLTWNVELCEEEHCKPHTHICTPNLQRAPRGSHGPNPDIRLLQVKLFLSNTVHSLQTDMKWRCPVCGSQIPFRHPWRAHLPEGAILKVCFKPLHHAALLIHLSLTFPGHVVLRSPLTAICFLCVLLLEFPCSYTPDPSHQVIIRFTWVC